jgi:flagellar biosynthesis/type III secretory pathway ATPase
VRLYPALETFLRQEKNETCEFDDTIRRLTGLFAGAAPADVTTRSR